MVWIAVPPQRMTASPQYCSALRPGFRLLAHSISDHPRYAKVLSLLKCPIGAAAIRPVRVVVVDVAARVDVPGVARVATIG